MQETNGPLNIHDPLAAKLSNADDRILLNHWLPPQQGIAPLIRVGSRWISTLWALPLGFAALVLAVAIAQSLREYPDVKAFIVRHPGIAQTAPSVNSGFPWWLRLQHFLNMLFMMFIIRAGIQILADHPRLYWKRDCTPGMDWFRFQRPVPTGRIWTAKDDSVTLPKWLGLPGLRHSIGLARWWHFSTNLLWTVNGIAFYVLLFSTDQWRRLVPLTWGVFPSAVSTAIQYGSLNFPVDQGWTRYNALQQLAYFATVFIAAPVSIATGLLQSPAISNSLGWTGRVLNRQVARSIHFLSFSWFVLFILAHGIMVFVTSLRENTNHIRRRARCILVGVLAVRAGDVRGGNRMGNGFAGHHTLRAAGAAHRQVHGRVDQKLGRMVGPAFATHRSGHLALLLAERHDAVHNMHHALTTLAYEMNGMPVSVLHGAPLRLRCENELGFKMVKWITTIEFVHDFADLGAGQGGYNEDHEFYGYRMPI